MPNNNLSPDTTSSPSRFLQLTDCHLGEKPGDQLLGLNTDQSLLDVIALAQQESGAELLLATGDISGDGSEQSYCRFVDTIRQHFAQPLAWLPGNHDETQIMVRLQQQLDVACEAVELKGWRLILLDSSVPGAVFGQLREEELQRLQALLQQDEKPTLVFAHHQSLPVGSAWMDQYTIRNASELLEMLVQYPQVKGLICGHVHQEYNGHYQSLPLLATPSTCIQFKPDCDDFAVDTTMPGYRWFDLYDDGHFETGVVRVAEKDYGIDFGSAGY